MKRAYKVLGGCIIATIAVPLLGHDGPSHTARGDAQVGAAQVPVAVEFEPAHAQPARLPAAREAAKRGDRDLAMQNYVASIREDAITADAAITELVDLCLSAAKAHGKDGRYVDESAQINQCYRKLQQLKQMDDSTSPLADSARLKLFAEMARVHAAANNAARCHILAGDQLRREAKGLWNDDEMKQAEALHQMNLAWSYYPAHTDEWMVSKMYEIWADMKSHLPTWQYNQVMECDRLHLGRTVGDRS